MWFDIFKFSLENKTKIKDFLDSAKRFEKKINSCLVLSAGDCYPVQFHLNTDQPYLQLWLKMNNFSRNLRFDLSGGIVEDIFVNNKIIIQGQQFVNIYKVFPSKSNDIYLKLNLNDRSINRLKEIEDIYNLEARLTIKLNIDTIKRKSEKCFEFNNIPCKLSLYKSPLALCKETLKKEADVLQDVPSAETSVSTQQDDLDFEKTSGTYISKDSRTRYCHKCLHSSPPQKVPLKEQDNGWRCNVCDKFYSNPNYDRPTHARNNMGPMAM